MTILKTWVIEVMVKIIYLAKLQVQGQFLAPIIIDTIVIFFYKTTYNSELTFNLATTRDFEFFCARMLTFLFVMIYCNIREY